jgi:hypothetical protein
MEGVVRRPSLFAITTGSLPSITATQELVVPKSIPITFPIVFVFYIVHYFRKKSHPYLINYYANNNALTKWHAESVRKLIEWGNTPASGGRRGRRYSISRLNAMSAIPPTKPKMA